MSARWQEYRPIHELTLFAASPAKPFVITRPEPMGEEKTNPQKIQKNLGKRTKDCKRRPHIKTLSRVPMRGQGQVEAREKPPICADLSSIPHKNSTTYRCMWLIHLK